MQRRRRLQKGDALSIHIADLVRGDEARHRAGVEAVCDDLQQRAVVANMRYNAQRLQHAKPILAENESQE